jgi:hypothetical protein
MPHVEKPRYRLKDILLGWMQATVICLIVLGMFAGIIWIFDFFLLKNLNQ